MPSALLWPLVIAGAVAGGPLALLRGREPPPALARRGRPVRHARLPVHPAQRRRRRGRPGRLLDQHPLRDPRPPRRRSLSRYPRSPRDGRVGSGRAPPSVARGCAWRAAARRLLRGHRPPRRGAARSRPPLRLADRAARGAGSQPRCCSLAPAAPRSPLWPPASAVLALAVVAIAYPVQRDYLRDRYLNADPEASIPGMHLDSAYRWARDVHDSRIGLAGTTAGFLGYGFYGTDLSNRVRYLGREAPHGGFEPIPTCRAFRAAVNAADLDYLVTLAIPQLHPPRQPGRIPRGSLAARRSRGRRRSSAAARSPSGASAAGWTRPPAQREVPQPRPPLRRISADSHRLSSNS